MSRPRSLLPRLAATLATVLVTTTLAHAQTPAQSPSQTQGPEERFYMAVPEGWMQTAKTEGPQMDVITYAPQGQEPASWTDMLTVQVYHGTTDRPLESWYEMSRQGYQDGCEDVRLGDLQKGMSNKYPSGFWVLACTTNKATGMGETAFFRLIQGRDALYLAQRAWRTPPFAKDTGPSLTQEEQREAVTALQRFGVCIPGHPDHPCPRLPE